MRKGKKKEKKKITTTKGKWLAGWACVGRLKLIIKV
jgi:hypothetical protein